MLKITVEQKTKSNTVSLAVSGLSDPRYNVAVFNVHVWACEHLKSPGGMITDLLTVHGSSMDN